MPFRLVCWLGIVVCSVAPALAMQSCLFDVVSTKGKDHCVDNMLGCNALLEADCLAIGGCKFDGGCVENGCAAFVSEDECTLRIGCGWSAGTCRPKGVGDCGKLLDPASCAKGKECIWVPGCGGKMGPCDIYATEAACKAAPQCEWTPGSSG
jgi:hypothetical protein